MEKHRGRLGQTRIYLGKLFRSFIYMDDWKNLPMAALIAALVAFVAAQNMFKTMEAAATSTLALSCICIWNGFFNSIQVVCRERDIIKREHRAGMHISAYMSAHMIYQAFICLCQTVITVEICKYSISGFPSEGFVTDYFSLDMGITVFLLTYAADMLSLMISAIAKSTTSAMTIMPFILIFELLFSGQAFHLDESLSVVTDFSLAKWGINCLSAQIGYNDLPMVTVWNQLVKFSNYEIEGHKPILEILQVIQENGGREEFLMEMGRNSQVAEYAKTYTNIFNCWLALALFSIVFAIIAILALERIDKDKR